MPSPLWLPISFIWSSATLIARAISRLGWPRREKLGARVVSVGNLVAGGAGKTPLVAKIAIEGLARGRRVIILTRGYRSRWESAGGLIRPNAPMPAIAECGDEAALLHDQVPGVWIGVGADRGAAFRRAQAAAGGFDLVILDDGFQNRRIAKDIELLALTSDRPWQRPFRDWPAMAALADLCVWTKGDRRPGGATHPLVAARYELPSPDASATYWLVTGLADGARACQSAKAAGWSVSRHLAFRDHHRYDREQVTGLIREAEAASARILLTGKDWVKWRELGVSADRVQVIEPRLMIREGEALWNRVLWGE